MQNRSFSDNPMRLSAAELLDKLFSPAARPASEILVVAKQLKIHPGTAFFKLPVPYEIRQDGAVMRSGLTSTMVGAVSTIIADLEAMSPDTRVAVDIDATRIPSKPPERTR